MLGTVVRFDVAKGYGFIAPNSGREDVFLHVNDLLIPEATVRTGMLVAFEVDEGDRGLRALNIRVPESDVVPAARPDPLGGQRSGHGAASMPKGFDHAAQGATPITVRSQAGVTEGDAAVEDQVEEFSAAITEMLLAAKPR